jgi:hypothetical protein
MEKFEIEILNYLNKKLPVAEVYYNQNQWAEISSREGELIIHFYTPSGMKYWEFSLEEAIQILNKAKDRLLKRLNEGTSLGFEPSQHRNPPTSEGSKGGPKSTKILNRQRIPGLQKEILQPLLYNNLPPLGRNEVKPDSMKTPLTTEEANEQGQLILEEILNDPNKQIYQMPNGSLKVYSSSGRGAFFKKDGSFRGFIEQKYE